MSRWRRGARPALVLLALAVPAPASAHPLAPSLLELRERPGGVARVSWRTPLVQPTGTALGPRLPDACRPLGVPAARSARGGLELEWEVDCGAAGWAGRRVGVSGLGESGTNALLRFVRADGAVVQALLTARSPAFEIPPSGGGAGASALPVMRSYLGLGVEHLLLGLDHVLFVIGLALLVRAPRRLVLTLTAFTLGHSASLSLAALGLVRIPSGPVEVAIAGSILLLAGEIARQGESGASLLRRRPWMMSSLFGLLHGLGFARALADVGLPDGEIPLALLAFNVGIEVGQLLVVAAVLAAVHALGAAGAARAPRAARLAPAYAFGALAGSWFLERAAVWLGIPL